MADLAKFMDAIKGATVSELHTFRELLERQLKVSFKAGDKVSFVGKYGKVETGRVVKVNRRLVAVKTTSGSNWRVHPSLLTKI
jgi:hypothetical protein